MLKYASTSIKHHLEDMKTLPAVTLLPDVQVWKIQHAKQHASGPLLG